MIVDFHISRHGTRRATQIDDFGVRVPSGLHASFICSPIRKVISFGLTRLSRAGRLVVYGCL